MQDRLKPKSVIFYGSVPEEFKADNVIQIAAYQDRLKKYNKPKEGNPGKDGE